ncbi:TspO and MBR related proteins [Duganella sp. CF402]|uniref:TspO/MBR family protein n=1 Tax=unclassified Duganella TaxID=2636909 RepID=UPI0008BE1BD1|nr:MULTISPECIES: TspO/MBR family protein [unclassified Duganella]RZT10765.1 TspO/MBR related protein [Duganella sp. BK701]SEK97677.1 TspO and MBR related proteins [Duganella sp. CF402]
MTTILRPLFSLAGWIAVTALFAVVASLGSLQAPTFYAQLNQPDWAPPAWLFGPVWTLLYLMMAVAAWRVARAGRSPALIVYLVQLVLNALWSWLFFSWHMGAAAFACIVVLWLLIAATIVLFRRIDGVAAALLLPYIAWVSFASALCFSIWQRNPGLL